MSNESPCPSPCPCPYHRAAQERERRREKRPSRAEYMHEWRRRQKRAKSGTVARGEGDR